MPYFIFLFLFALVAEYFHIILIGIFAIIVLVFIFSAWLTKRDFTSNSEKERKKEINTYDLEPNIILEPSLLQELKKEAKLQNITPNYFYLDILAYKLNTAKPNKNIEQYLNEIPNSSDFFIPQNTIYHIQELAGREQTTPSTLVNTAVREYLRYHKSSQPSYSKPASPAIPPPTPSTYTSKARQIPKYTHFLAIDFETANSERASICAVGIYLEDSTGKSIFAEHILINPETTFNTTNVSIHGINASRVKNKPKFPYVHSILYKLLEDYPNTLIIAHNTAFDISVLRKSCERYHLPNLTFEYICTMRLAKALYPIYTPHSLDNLSSIFNLPTFSHHNALADAKQALSLFWALYDRSNANSVTSLMLQAQLKIGLLSPRKYIGCTRCKIQQKTL